MGLAEEVTGQLLEAIHRAFDALGRELVQETKDKLDVSVGIERGSRGGTVYVRSKVGEYARRQSGALYESISYTIVIEGTQCLLEITSNAPHAQHLMDMGRRVLPTIEETEDRLNRLMSELEI